MKSPLRNLCCFSNGEEKETDTPLLDDPIDEVAQEVTAVQTTPTDQMLASACGDVVASGEEENKELKSETAAATPTVPSENTPTTKVSRSSSSTSYMSSDSVQTAIERWPTLIREDSKESVVTAIERTPSPKASKNDDEQAKAASHDSHEGEGLHESPSAGQSATSPKSPTSQPLNISHHSPASHDSSASSKGMSEDHELPEDVTSLDEVKKLNELIDDEKYDLKHPFWDKISLFYGDITKIQVDAIVNAANDRLGGGGGVDGAIHRAAGHNQLQTECRKHDRPVPTGEAVVTEACKLSTHIKKIIHCVGPICYGGVTNEKRKKLESCYRRAIQLSEENELRSIAFCCISTGIYGYDNKDAARTVLRFLWKHFNKEQNVEKWDRVVLCLFMEIDKQCYKYYIKELLDDPSFFDDEEEKEDEEDSEDETKKSEDDENKEEEGKEEKKDENEETKEEDHDEKEEKKEEEKTTKDDGDKEETDSKASTKTVDKEKEFQSKGDADMTDKAEDTVSETESKMEKSTVEEESSKIEDATTSASEISTTEKMEEEADGGKGEGEKENHATEGFEKEEGVTNKKRVQSEEREDEPPLKRDKPERESSV